jgi:hypothetical protein
MSTSKSSSIIAEPPAWHLLPVVHATTDVRQWLDHYWAKLQLPGSERARLAVTQDRTEFARWTGRRLNPLALGCYCYLPPAQHDAGAHTTLAHAATEAHALPSEPPLGMLAGQFGVDFAAAKTDPLSRHRHLVFIEPDLFPLGVEVTVAHELIHLADRVSGHPRRHRCHGYDAIAIDEAAVTGYDAELLRQLLRDETTRREGVLRRARPIRYIYCCPKCGKEYPRVRRYSRPVSCGTCARSFNPDFLLVLRSGPPTAHVASQADI